MLKKLKLKGLKYICVFMIFFVIIFYGFTAVSSKLPDFIKEHSSVKVSFNLRPFDLQFDVGDYIIYLNGKVIDNLKENTFRVFKSIGRSNPVQNVEQYNPQ